MPHLSGGKLASWVQREGPVPLTVGLLGNVMLVLLAEDPRLGAGVPASAPARILTTLALAAQGAPLAGLAAFVCGVIGWRSLPRAPVAVASVLGGLSSVGILPVDFLALLAFVPASFAACSDRTRVRLVWLGLAVASALFGLSVWRDGLSAPEG